MKSKTINAILIERGAKYGVFSSHAKYSQDIKDVIRSSGNIDKMQPDQIECLEMIAHKMGRILNGDPDYEDSWRDIAGYATLVADRLIGKGL